MQKTKLSVKQLAGTALLAGVVVILQLLASGIKIGTFNITLTLVPIIIGAILYGPVSGAVLGAVFGLIVSSAVISGADPGGAILFAAKPVTTVLVCMVKSTVAGFLSGLVARSFAEHNLNLGVMLAAVTAPVVNTGIFVLSLLIFFSDILSQWAAGSASISSFIIFGLVGANFILELVINAVLVPIVVRIIHAARQGQYSE